MIYKILIGAILLLAVSLTFLGINISKNSGEVAYVDTYKLLHQSRQMIEVRKALEDEQNKLKKNLDTLSSEIQALISIYKRDASKLTKNEKQLTEELLQAKQSELLKYEQAVKSKLNKLEQEETQKVLTEINEYISDYGSKNNYKIIFATSNGNIAFADLSLDITDEILKGINN